MQVSGGELVSIHNFDEKNTVNSMAQNNFVGRYGESDKSYNQGVWIGLRTDKVHLFHAYNSLSEIGHCCFTISVWRLALVGLLSFGL